MLLEGHQGEKMTGEQSDDEHQAEISRLNKLHTAELLEQDLCHKTETNQLKRETNQLKTEMALRTVGMLKKQIACHKAENKQTEAQHKEKINLMKAVHNAETQRQDSQHKKETRRKDVEMADQDDCHWAEMKSVKGQYEATILNLDQEINRQKEKIKQMEEELYGQHPSPSGFTLTSSTITLIAAIFTLVGSFLTLVASRQNYECTCTCNQS